MIENKKEQEGIPRQMEAHDWFIELYQIDPPVKYRRCVNVS